MTAPKTAATMYRWDDPNAPVVCGIRGSLIALLKACLVDGYNLTDQDAANHRVGAGWTMPHVSVDALQAAFRTNELVGPGKYLKVNERTTASANLPGLQGFEAMADIDTGLGAFPAAELVGGDANNSGLYLSAAASSIPRPWVIVANDVFVWIAIWYETGMPATLSISSRLTLFAFGDFPAFSPDDLHPTLIWRSGTSSQVGSSYDSFKSMGLFTAWLPNHYQCSLYSSAPIFFARTMAGEGPTYSRICLVNGGGYAGDGGRISPLFCEMGPVYSPGDPLCIIRHFIDNPDGLLRGYVPGLEVPFAVRPFTPGQIVDDPDSSTRYVYIGGRFNNNYAGALINITNFWRP